MPGHFVEFEDVRACLPSRKFQSTEFFLSIEFFILLCKTVGWDRTYYITAL